MKNVFGNRLRKLRKERKLTAKEFGAKFGLAESTISGYENGNRTPDLELIDSFATFFNVSVDYLLGRTNDPQRTKENELNSTKDIIEFLEKTNDLHVGGQKLNEKQRKILIDFMKSVVAPRLQDQDKHEN
jgi:transcriptional regulator with XRE-family HTH domain